jgi:hypothetical protein
MVLFVARPAHAEEYRVPIADRTPVSLFMVSGLRSDPRNSV